MDSFAAVSPRRRRSLEAQAAGRPEGFSPFPLGDVELSIAQRFSRMAALYPRFQAVRAGATALTYEQLDAVSNGVASRLLDRGVRPGDRVALACARPDLLAAGVLGAAKAGAAFVILDAAAPAERNRRILDDCEAAATLTDASCQIPSAGPSPAAAQPGDLSCLVYTSGSTGAPKGVMRTHREMLHHVLKFANGIGAAPGERLSMLYSPATSAGIRGILTALLTGTTLCPYDVRREGVTGLAAWLASECIAVWDSVPTLYRAFAAGLTGGERFPDLRLVSFTGESLCRSDFEIFRRVFDDRAIFRSSFGATEANSARHCFFTKDDDPEGALIPSGYPTDQTEILLLDDNGHEVEPGSTGEIVVESPYLSAGYWRRPEWTRAAFSDSPRPGWRRYRTGDLGRMLEDGCLFHLGRKDSQVKIRGQRVETAEIEVALRAAFGIHETVVVARNDGAGSRLVAYLVPRGERPTLEALRTALARVLPGYMVPSAFVLLDRMPVAEAGKIDRRALPLPDGSRPNLETPYRAPRTPLEERLAESWSELLDVRPIGIDDHFLALGGDSILAAQMLSRVYAAHDVELPLAGFMDAPTVAGLALAITQAQAASADSAEVARFLTRLQAGAD